MGIPNLDYVIADRRAQDCDFIGIVLGAESSSPFHFIEEQNYKGQLVKVFEAPNNWGLKEPIIIYKSKKENEIDPRCFGPFLKIQNKSTNLINSKYLSKIEVTN